MLKDIIEPGQLRRFQPAQGLGSPGPLKDLKGARGGNNDAGISKSCRQAQKVINRD